MTDSDQTHGSQLLSDKRVIELGSGPGLCGLLSANWAKSVVLTDYQDLVMDLIQTNIDKCNPREGKCELYCARLDWTKVKEEFS